MAKQKRFSLVEDKNRYRYKYDKSLFKIRLIIFISWSVIYGGISFIFKFLSLRDTPPSTELGLIVSICVDILVYIILVLYIDYKIIKFFFVCILSFRANSPEEYHGKPIYCVDLMSISKDIDVDPELSYEENIRNAKWYIIDQLLVQETLDNDYYREIVSGTLIPRSSIITYIKDKNTSSEDEAKKKKKYYGFESPVFTLYEAKVSGRKDYIVESCSHRRRVTYTEVKKYVTERIDSYRGFTSFSLYIENIFEVGNKYYDKTSNEEKITKLLKTLR